MGGLTSQSSGVGWIGLDLGSDLLLDPIFVGKKKCILVFGDPIFRAGRMQWEQQPPPPERDGWRATVPRLVLRMWSWTRSQLSPAQKAQGALADYKNIRTKDIHIYI